MIHYPVTQTPIPHPSRSNYILNLNFGLNYFIVPYGAMILALPFIFIRGSKVARLRPLMLGFWIAFLIGLGGTTPVGHWLLQRAYRVLTMERFSYWATLLALPFIGLIASELIARSALMREESRGAHYREDFAKSDDANWLKNIYLARNGIGLKSWTESVKLDRISP